MNLLPPLLAAIDAEVIKAIVVLVIVAVLWIVKLLAAMQQAQPPVGGPRPQQPPRPVPADAADEIDNFLRRAAQQRTVQATPQRAAQPAQLKAVGQTFLSASDRQNRDKQRQECLPHREQKPIVAEVVAAAPVGGQVTDHVQKYLDTGDFTRRGDQLGEEVVAQVNREIDQHLHQVFDHSVSQLAAVPGEAATPPVAFEPLELSEASAIEIPATFATGLTTLLTSPESICQAIVLSEIIHRPEERW